MTRSLSGTSAEVKEEERALDQELGEYAQLLNLVDERGGFAQVIDWVRVRRETEECRQDLRRLGWNQNQLCKSRANDLGASTICS